MLLVYAAYDEHHATQRAEAAKVDHSEAIAACENSVDTVSALACVDEALSAQPSDPYAAYDLQAQQEMAKWAALMFFVTGFGVIYVALTLEATRNAVKEAEKGTGAALEATKVTREIGEIQTRAYVTAVKARALRRKAKELPDRCWFAVVIILNNSGQSPALNLTTNIVAGFSKNGELRAEPNPDEAGSSIVGPNTELVADIDVVRIFLPGQIQTAIDSGYSLYAKGTVEYIDIYGIRWTHTFSLKAHDFNKFLDDGINEISMGAVLEGNTFRRKEQN